MRKSIILLALAAVLLFIACQDNNVDSSQPQLEDGGRILFKITEGYPDHITESEPIIKLYSETEYNYPYFNYEIITTAQSFSSGTIVNYNSIDVPLIIAPAFGPATSSVELPLNDGWQNLSFVKNYNRDIYQVNVTEDAITILPQQADITGLLSSIYYRYKPNSFVFLYESSNDHNSHYAGFLDTLQSAVDLTEFSYDDDLTPYTQAKNWGHPNTPPRYFQYQTDGDFQRVEEIFAAYMSAYLSGRSDISIKIITWKNRQLDSSDY